MDYQDVPARWGIPPIVSSPPIIARVSTPGTADAIAIAGSLVFLADGESGLSMFDISTPESPIRIGTLATFADVSDVMVSPPHAILSTDQGLMIADVSIPARATVLSVLASVTPRALEGTLIYAIRNNEIVIIEAADPAKPSPVGSVAIGIEAQSVTALESGGGRLYAATRCGNPWGSFPCGYPTGMPPVLHVFDITDPRVPVERSRLDLDHPVDGMVIGRDHVYLVSRPGLVIVDVSSDTDPFIVGEVAFESNVRSVAVRDSLMYVVTEVALEVLQISDPSAPYFRGKLETNLPGRDIAVWPDGVGVALRNAGLLLLPTQCTDSSPLPESPLKVPPLLQIRSNPTIREADLSIDLPRPGRIQVIIYDPLGRQVRHLWSGMAHSDRFSLSWDARDDFGRRVQAGVYFARLITSSGNAVERIVVAL